MAESVSPEEGKQPGLFDLLVARARKARQDPKLRRLGWSFSALLILLGGLDVVSTTLALAAGNSEGNPLVHAMQINLGSWWGLPKVMIHLLFAYFVLWLPTRRMLRAASIVCLFYLFVVASNFYLAYGSSQGL